MIINRSKLTNNYSIIVVFFPDIMLAQSKEMSETLRKIYKASSDFIGDASFYKEERTYFKLSRPQGWQGSKNRMGPVLFTFTAIGA